MNKRGGRKPIPTPVRAKPGVNVVYINNKRIVFKDGTAIVSKTTARKLEKGGYIYGIDYQGKESVEQNMPQPKEGKIG